MFLPIATALMGKALYDKQRANDAERQDMDEERQHLRLQRQRQQQQWAKDDQFQASMVNAGRVATVDPNMVKSEEQDNRDVGLAGEAAPTQQGFRVNGQVMASMADAQKAADAHNAPGAVTARMSQALLAAGKPVEAQQLRAGARQEEVGILQADQLKQAAERDRKLREVGGLIIKGGWASVPEVYSRYQDGYSAKVEPDGKGGATVIGLDESGKEVGRTQYAGLTDFFADVAGQFDPSKWLEHKEKRADKAEATARWNAEMKLKEDSEKRKAIHEQALLRATQARNAGQPAVVEQFDLKLARDTAHDTVKAENKRRAEANQPLLSGVEMASMIDDIVAAQQAQHGNRLFSAAASNELSGLDQASPAYAAMYQRFLARGDAKAVQSQLEKLGFKPPPAPAKSVAGQARSGAGVQTGGGASPTVAAKPSPAQGAPSAAVPPQQAPSQPGPFSRLVARMSDLGVDYSSDQGKSVLASRVQEAAGGGRALSETEALRAKQAGLI